MKLEVVKDEFLKQPIFISGVPDSESLNAVVQILENDRFEIVVLNQDLHRKCEEVYHFERLGNAEKVRISNIRKDEKLRKEALESAYEIEKILKEAFSFQDHKKDEYSEEMEGRAFTFKTYELKNLIAKFRRKDISNKQSIELIELLEINGFLTCLNPGDVKNKQEFALTIDDGSRLMVLNDCKNRLLQNKQTIENAIKMYDDEIAEISKKLSETSVEETKDESNEIISEISENKNTPSEKVLEIIEEAGEISGSSIGLAFNNKSVRPKKILDELIKEEKIVERKEGKTYYYSLKKQ